MERGLRLLTFCSMAMAGDTLDEIAFGLTHTSQKLAGVTAEAFHIAPLPLGIECIECERGLAGTGQSGYDDQLVAGNFHINIFQIIDACPFMMIDVFLP